MDDPVKVLVIEDDEILREVLTDVLMARGLDVVASGRGDKAVEMARQERFDLIVADIRMEGMNGLDAIEKAREFQPDVGSIVVSGFASEEETLRAVRLNVAGYLKKPFEVPELMEMINAYLAQRAERLRREREQRGLSEALMWSLEQQAAWAEEARPGTVLRASRLAGRLAQELGFPAEMGRQTFLGTALRQLEGLGGAAPGPEALSGLESYATLMSAWQQRDPESPSDFAVALCLHHLDGWPAAEQLSSSSESLLNAYRRMLAREDADGVGEEEASEGPPLEQAPAGLLALARTLEHGGDLDGARAAFEQITADSGTSPAALAGLLGQARVAVTQGATAVLEKTMSDLLALAEKLGPVTFALAELEGAKILQRAGHPATRKLLTRAAQSLGRVNLTLPWAVAVVSYGALVTEGESSHLDRAFEVLSSPQYQQEISEHLDALAPALLSLGEQPKGRELASRLVRDYPYDIASQLRSGRLDQAARACLVGLLESHGASVPEALLEQLRHDPDPELRSRGVALQAERGRSEAIAVLRVHSLGQVEVSLGDQPVDERSWKTQKTKLLFAKLADHFPRPLSADRLMAELWPDSDQAGARNNLNAAVSNMRKPLRSGPKGFDPVLRNGDMLGLNPEQPFWHDVKELELAHQQAQRALEVGNVEVAMSHFSRVVRLYRGPYIEGAYFDWISQRQSTLENKVVEALQHLTTHRVEQHRYREALEYALRLIVLQPEHERAHLAAMTSYLGLEQHDKAIAHHEAHKGRLEEELGDEAQTELARLYQMARYGFVQEPGFKPK